MCESERKAMDADKAFENEVFEYLDALRESGVTNMFGAGSYICDEFDVSKKDARFLLAKWMSTFSERHPTA